MRGGCWPRIPGHRDPLTTYLCLASTFLCDRTQSCRPRIPMRGYGIRRLYNPGHCDAQSTVLYTHRFNAVNRIPGHWDALAT
jgi:hypothetical protein